MSGRSTDARVRLVPLTGEDFATWAARSVRGFAAQQVAAGANREPDATAYAHQQLAELLPHGLRTPGHCLWTLHEAPGAPVGYVWLQLRRHPAGVEAYLLDLDVAAPHQGRGLGRAALLAVEDEARRRGAVAMGLNVFGHNEPARALYRGLGYTVVQATFSCVLPPQPSSGPSSGPSPGPSPGPSSGGDPAVLREMGEAEFARLRPSLREQNDADLDRLLPCGPASIGHRLWTAHAGDSVGAVWMQLQHRVDGVHALLRHIEVDASAPARTGHGPEVLRAVQRGAADLGVRTLTVVLAGSATDTRDLVEDCGFALVAETLTKPL